MIQSLSKLFTDELHGSWARIRETYQLGLLLDLLDFQPYLLVLIERRRQAHERNGTKPTGLDERPDQKAIEIKVLSTAKALCTAEFDGENVVIRLIARDLDDLIALESSNCFLEVGLKTLCWKNEFAAK